VGERPARSAGVANGRIMMCGGGGFLWIVQAVGVGEEGLFGVVAFISSEEILVSSSL
jgi:hypothetical protein